MGKQTIRIDIPVNDLQKIINEHVLIPKYPNSKVIGRAFLEKDSRGKDKILIGKGNFENGYYACIIELDEKDKLIQSPPVTIEQEAATRELDA